MPRAIVQRDNDRTRLSWLLTANDLQRRRRNMFRDEAEEEQMLLMRRPISVERAFALFGLALGTIVPAAIFARMFGYGLINPATPDYVVNTGLFMLCLMMNLVCALAGYAMGSTISRTGLKLERSSWIQMLCFLPFLGAFWGLITGLTGGVFFFGIGGIIGPLFAIPVGIVGFTILCILHRLLERGGMIELRHMMPIAMGLAMTMAALVLGY